MFNAISSKWMVKLVPYEWDSIESAVKSEHYDAVLVDLNFLDHDKAFVLHKITRHSEYSRLPLFLLGTKEECKEQTEVWHANAVFNILTPVSDITVSLERAFRQLEVKNGLSDSDKAVPVRSSKRCILVVDDDPVILHMMSNLLSSSYSVAVAKSGAAAISYLANHIPDLILLDYMMPLCDGPQTLRMIRSENNTRSIPVFFLTGVSDMNQVKTAMELKPEGYLLKSCSSDEILSRISSFFENCDHA